ncbi:hypothetical protein L506_0681 [Bordetella bronchiseptica GA96-01]|nr:hypothetical protein L506_0681 [Bordetella bronchiseptica GA96-01]
MDQPLPFLHAGFEDFAPGVAHCRVHGVAKPVRAGVRALRRFHALPVHECVHAKKL